MAWTPPSDAVVAGDKSWTPPKDAVAAKGWTPPKDAVTEKAKPTTKTEAPPAATTDAMGADLGAAIMGAAEPRPEKTFTGSVFDTQPFEPPFDPAEAARLSRREYAERTMQPPRRMPPEMRPSPEYVGKPRTLSEANFDIWAGALQGGAGFVKGILDNIPGGDDPISGMLGSVDQGLERLKTPQLRSSQIAREGRIARARELEGEVGAARATFQTMFTPAGADIVAKGAGSLIPTVGMSLAGLGYKAINAANALSNAGDAAVQSAEQLKRISPEQWSKDEVYRSLRDKGLSHRDAVAMLAPIYAFPAQAAGAATGYVSGATGFEKALTRGTEKGVLAAGKRFGAEQLGEMQESLAPQFVGNLIASTIEPQISPTQGLGQTAVETAFGALPGAGLAALPSKKKITLDAYAQSRGYTDVQDMIRKVMPTVGRKSLEDELIGALDKEADEQDARDQQQAEGAPDARQPVTPADRAGIQVAGQPSAEPPAPGAGIVEPSGVVPTRQPAATPAEGAPAEPPALTDDFIVMAQYRALSAEGNKLNAEEEQQGRVGVDNPLVAAIKGITNPLYRNEQTLQSSYSYGVTNGRQDIADVAAAFLRDQFGVAPVGPPRDYSLTNSPQNTPLLPFITGINKQLDTFYNDLYGKPVNELPETLQKYRYALDDANAALEFVQARLAKWNHPAITGKNQGERAAAKAKATAEDRELLDVQGQIAGGVTRLANQAMALHKGYKGKKAGNPQKILAARNQLDADVQRAIQLLYDRGLLSDEEAVEWENMKEREAIQAEPAALETPEELPEPPQAVPVDKPAPITDLNAPEAPGDSTTPAPVEDKPYHGSDEINALGDRIKGVANKITSDFMVGDLVRYGATSGVVVGTEGAYARVHPDGAKNPKAYYRVPKASLELVARPDTTSKTAAMAMPGEDKKFGVEQGKLNADMGGLIQLLGANMYATAVAEVAVKELLQNAFDAVKGAVSSRKAPALYKSGEITITINDDDRTITVTDNARGMTPEIVRDAFFTVAGSDKSDLTPEERSGGLGLAKMGFMLGSERLILDTVRDGVRVRVDTSAQDIANSNFQIIKTSANKKEHGTTVTVKIPEYYIDPKTGEQKAIYFSGNPEFYDALKQPLIGPVTVKTVRKSSWADETTTLPVGLDFPADKYIQFKVNFSWGSADIYFSKERNPGNDWDIKHQVLSSGVYQFNADFKLNKSEKIPYDIIVNIKPSVEAKHPDYPFENSRERFKGRLKEDIASLNEYLAQIARGNEAQDLQENFKNIVSMPRVDVGSDIADTTQKLKKSFDNRGATTRRELPPMPKEVRVEGTRVVSVDTGKTIADRAKQEEKQTKGTFTAETAAPEMKDFLLQMAQNPNQPIFHNNTNVDYLEVGRQYGNPEVFFAELGTLMVEMKEALANSGMYGYDVLKPENLFFGGVSIDKKYGGVHIKVPYKAVLINPFYDFGAKTLFGAREYLWETMTHEIAHTGDMGHGVGHNTHMLKVRQQLADEGLADYFRDALMDMLVRHESTFTAMREAYGRSTTTNTAKSLEDYGKGSASISDGSAASSSEDTVRPLPAGRGQGGYGDIRTAGPLDRTSGIPRAAGSTSPDSVKGLHQDVVDAINRNDIGAALRAIARNTSGLYAELARRLAELNLPTSIIFNNERALVRQEIDDRSAQQQIRLFAYINRANPAFYEQYFKDYDRAENLERVAEGLVKINLAKVDLAPINTELAHVQETFRKTMPGLTAPGFFSPGRDAINIRPDAKFGSSNRVVLHEIVHAATEAMLHGKLTDLTAEQMQAVADLYEMYDFAQTKIPPGEYGFTNISEFIAEAMTNPKFQAKLKAVSYPVRKASVYNSFLRFLANLFGMGNLAGAATSAINDILSARRPPGGTKPTPLRFATQGPSKKRVRGPISKPDTWRTAERVQTTLSNVAADAARGRVPLDSALKEMFGSLWDANGTAVRAVVLPVLQLRQLKDLTRTKFPQLTGAVDIVEKMVAFRGSKIKIAENIVQKWTPLQSKYPKQSGLMSRIMLEATIRGRDPDAGVPPGAAPDALDNAWNALRPEFKQLYRDVRDFYADSVKEMVRTMKQRVIGLPKAERQEKLRKINEQFGPDKLLAPYFPLRRFGDHWFQIGKGQYKEFYTFESAVGRNLAFNKRRRELKKGNALQRAAADTMRMGNGISELYSQNVATTQVLKDVVEMVDSLSTTRTPPSQKEYTRLENILKAKLGRLPTKAEVEDKYYTETLKSEVKDSLNQLIYLLLPQQSMRKMFINRRAIQGASSDMLRVFATTAVHSAYQQARLKYAEPFINNVNNARDYINELEDTQLVTPQQGAVYRDYVLELERRTKNILGVEDKSPLAQITGAITGTTFFFMLSAPVSALMNIVGMTQLTMPYIGGRYGYAKTNATMLKYAGLYGASMPGRTLAPAVKGNFMQVSFPSIVESSLMAKLDPVVQRAAQQFVEDGDINISMTNDIFDLSERPSDLYTGKANAVKKLLSGIFHQAERFNREVALLSVFELAYDKFSKADRRDIRGVVERDPRTNQPRKYTPDEAYNLAIQEARDIAGLTLGDYTRQMKGRVFTLPSVNLISQFKQYAITATYNVLRNFYLSIAAPFRKGEIEQFRMAMIKDGLPQSVIDQRLDEAEAYRKELYREGMKRLAGILGMTFLYGGVAAQPFFSMLGTLIKMFAPDDDDEFFDWENWFYNFMVTEVGGAAAALFTKLGADAKKSEEAGRNVGLAIARGPVATITGGALADRVSLDLKNLWWREGRYSPDARESLQQDVIANIGPSVGLGLNWADAWQLAGEGQWGRAFEKAAPAMFSKPAMAFRIGEEGATSRSGNVIGGQFSDQFTTWQLAMLAAGLMPENLSLAQKAVIQAQTYKQKVLDRRAALLNRLWMERGTPAYADALEKANEFSLLYPEVAIDGDAISKSFDARAEAKAQIEAVGANIDEKLIGRLAPMLRYGMK